MKLQNFLSKFTIAASLACAPLAGFGDDIDLFKGGTTVTGQTPNVLIIVDNTVNWNNNANHWPGGKQAQEELEALSTVVGTLTGDVSIGVMMINNSAGYVRFGLRPMNDTNRTALQSILTGMSQNTGSNDVPTSQGDYGALMYEAWKYFSGASNASITSSQRDYAGNGSYNVSTYTAGNVSGNPLSSSSSTTYVQPLSSTNPCNKNFIIFIGNGFPSTSSTNPSSLSVTGWTASDSTQIYDEGTKTTYLDEWARFLYKTGIKNLPCAGSPSVCADGKITTYTIDVYKDHIDTPQTNLLKSAASVGGGKYFAATSKDEITTALGKIIAEVQAVNSVFTSASLPVSVNTQGTYLNQIYMGVFRPDSQGQPRWVGNLKQYKFGITTDATGNDTIFLADADGNAAVNSTSGFVQPTARSYWSKTTTPGFWAYSPSGSGGAYDNPDGDLVEKGGAAQRLREMGPSSRTMYTCTSSDCLTSGSSLGAFTTTNTTLVSALSGTSSSIASLTRSGTTVSVTTSGDLGLSSPTDSVSISGTSVSSYNTSVTATKVDSTHFTFTTSETPATPATGSLITVSAGSSTSQSLSSGAMTYNSSNGTVSVFLPAHGFINGQSVTISGATVSASMSTANTKCTSRNLATPTDATCEYNGTYTITYVDSNNFTFVPPSTNFGTTTTVTGTTINPPDTGITPGTSTLTCQYTGNPSASAAVNNTSITKVGTGAGLQTFKIVLASMPTNCGVGTGSTSLQFGGTGNNKRIITLVVSGTGTLLDGTQTVTGVGTSCSTGTVTTASNDRTICVQVTATSTNTTATTTIQPASPATGTIFATGIPTRTVASITRTAGNASNVATVTVTTATAHGFGAASSVTISGADQSEYNGTKTTAANGLSIPSGSGSTTFTFTLTTGPTASATGGTAARGSTVDPTTLISWVRGVDNKEDENSSTTLTDCRASIHGDVLHSRPLVINYGGTTGIYAFYGSNDGTFRAVKAGQDESSTSLDGKEAWSFVASEHYNTLSRLYNNSPLIKYYGTSSPRTARNYFFDGNIGVYQSADLATTHIFISMRRGGRFIYALDVSDPTAPKFLWKKSYTDTGMSELGYTWSEPKVIPIKRTTGVSCNTTHSGLTTDAGSSYIRALVFGAGYDPTSDDTDQVTSSTAPRRPNATMGRGVFVLNAADGSLIKLLQPPTNDYKGNSNSTRAYPIPSDVTVLDSDGDGCVDRIYVGDTGAKMHRFDIGDANSANWKAYTIGTFGDEGDNGTSNDRKFLFAPEVVLGVVDGKQVAYVMAGTGDREQPSQTSQVDNNFYMIRDTILQGDAVATSAATTNAVKDSNMISITNFNSSTTTINAAVVNGTSCTKNSSSYSTSTPCFWGWKLAYETGEKSVNAALAVAGTLFFGTNKPQTASTTSCQPNLGVARGYALNFLGGTSAVGDRDGNGTINRSDLYSVFQGGGLPPSPVSGVVQISASKTVRFVIGSGGTGTIGSAIEGVKTQVNPSGTRTRVFWYFKKDD